MDAAYGRAHPEYAAQRAIHRRRRLRDVRRDRDTVYIFTDAQTELNECVADYRALSYTPTPTPTPSGPGPRRRFFSVVLTCSLEENVRRLASAGREGSGKLTDPEVLRGWRERDGREIWRFGGEDEVVIDVSSLSAGAAAERIRALLERRQGG